MPSRAKTAEESLRWKEQRFRTAIHEAGHAVTACLLGREFHYVSIVEDDEFLGHLRTRRQLEVGESNGASRRLNLEMEIMIFLAGGIAEWVHTGRHDWDGASNDLDKANDLAARICDSPKEIEAFLNWLWIRTESMIRSQASWSSITAVADCLVVKERMTFRNVRGIVSQTKKEMNRGKKDRAR